MRKTIARVPVPGARTRYIIGVDEVGRGPLAGPVTVAAVFVPAQFPFEHPFSRTRLRDSKRLSAKQRTAWLGFLKRVPGVRYAVVSVSPRHVDRMNISRAANSAATRAFDSLCRKVGVPIADATVLTDAGLRIDGKKLIKSGILSPARSLVKGDERIQAIAFASIVAKVTRDRLMERLDGRYPAYGFAAHKGYGTSFHLRAIREHGPSPVHRLTFIRGYGTLGGKS